MCLLPLLISHNPVHSISKSWAKNWTAPGGHCVCKNASCFSFLHFPQFWFWSLWREMTWVERHWRSQTLVLLGNGIAPPRWAQRARMPGWLQRSSSCPCSLKAVMCGGIAAGHLKKKKKKVNSITVLRICESFYFIQYSVFQFFKWLIRVRLGLKQKKKKKRNKTTTITTNKQQKTIPYEHPTKPNWQFFAYFCTEFSTKSADLCWIILRVNYKKH